MGKFTKILRRLNPRTGRIITESGQAINIADVANRYNQASDPFGVIRVTEYQPIFSSRPITVSVISDRDFTTGSASITVEGGEYKLTNPGGETCLLETAQRGRYQSGLVGVPGVGIRRTTAPTGSTVYRWGYFDSEDGFGFKEDSNGMSTFVIRDGEEVYSKPRSEWLDPLDGTGPSGRNINPLDGRIYRFPFLWYGYGSLTMGMIVPGTREQDDHNITIDRYNPSEEMSVKNPNLPISVQIEGDSAGEMFVGGRQYGVYGKLDLRSRFTGEQRDDQPVSSSLVPTVSARVRTTKPWVTIPTQVEGFGNISDQDLDAVIILGGTLTNGGSVLTDSDWNLSQFSDGDTSVEFNINADAITGGEIIGGPFLVNATGSGANATGSATVTIPAQDIPIGEPVTFVVRSRGADATVSTAFRMKELR